MYVLLLEYLLYWAHNVLCFTIGISCSSSPPPSQHTQQTVEIALFGGDAPSAAEETTYYHGLTAAGGSSNDPTYEAPPISWRSEGGDGGQSSSSTLLPSTSASSCSFSFPSSFLLPQQRSSSFLTSSSPLLSSLKSPTSSSSSSSHPCDHCDSYVWHATSCLATTSLILFGLATTLTMLKVVRNYSKKSERKSESSRAAAQQGGQHSSISQQHSSSQQAIGGGAGGGQNSSYYEEYSRNGGAGGYGNGHVVGSNGQMIHHADNRHLSNAVQTHHGGFSESSSYETREHFERKVQRVKKTRGERERSRSMRRDEVSEALHGSDATSARDALLQWARKVTAGYPRVNVNNFSSSWRDGLAFNAILHRYRPNAVDWNKISDESVSNRERLDNAFATAEREFGVSRLLDAEDVDTNNPDEKSIITYVSSLYNALPHLPELNRGNSNDIISRLERGIGIVNEKLDLNLKRIEDVEARVDTSPPAAVERTVTEIVDDLNALEAPIAGFFEDVEELKTMQHPEANDFYRRVYGLHQRRTAYLDRLTNQILVRLGVRTDTLHKENQQRLENMRQTSFSRVEECIEWVRVRMEKLTTMEFLEDLETLEHVFEQHKLDNRDIQDFRQNVDECIARQAEVSAEDTYEYCELLRVLESEYQQLRDLSAGRMLDLDSLIAFVRAAQLELIWVSERERIEVTRNWSDIKQLDLPMLTNYYKQLLHEMELREKQYNDVHNQGAALLNQGHPAVRVIEIYLKTMQTQWDWLLALSKCLEEHLRDALNLKSFMEEAADAEAWIEEQSARLENNYNRTDFSLEEGERFLRELDEIKEILNKYHQVLMALTERCASISPLWQRGERIPHPMNVTALCDYADQNITIKAGDDVVLLDNSDLIKWTVRDLSGVEGQVPSVVFRIPPPDARLTAFLNRLLQQFEKLKKLWEKKHRMVRFNMVLNTMRTIQGWDLDTFNSIDPDQRDAIMKALNDDASKLLSELDPNDPLALRLREELRKTNEHFWNLLNASQKPPEPDWASQYDQKMSELLRKLEEAWRRLNDAVGKPISNTPEDLERVIHEHKRFEDALQALDGDVANVKELFRQLPNPTPTQRVNHDRLNGLWDDLWDLSRMYVERIKVLESVLNGKVEVADIVKQHEITLNSFDDLPAALDKLRGHHSQLLEINMVLKQQQTVIDQLNRNVALLRQHVARTRINEGHHPDVDAIEDEVQRLNVRWENVNSQIAERLLAVERALQIQMVYRSEYETEMKWLDDVEETINRLRKPDELRPEEYQKQLDQLIGMYSHLQEHTQNIENVNKEGGRFIHEAKIFDAKLGHYSDTIVGIHGVDVRGLFRRTKPQPKNGAQIVTEELELLNRRFAQLSSLILERRNTMQVLIQNWKRQKEENVTQVVSFREAEVNDMLGDLTRFRQEIFTTHLTFNPNTQSVDAASKNVQKMKESLDSWRDKIKERLDAIDQLCREEGDSMTPEQYQALREMRRQLADEYETVLRTVEGIHTRLNILSSLLIEFSSLTSSMQSWMTDRTRLAGDIRHKSGDSQKSDDARFEAKSLMEEVIREESRLKTIGASVLRIEQEIAAMYDDVRASGSDDVPSGISVDEVHETRRRVEDDYTQLLRQCQDLIQFQNRVHAMNDEHSEQARRADEWLQTLQKEVEDVETQRIPDDDRIQRIEELNRMAAGGSSQLDEAESASRRLLNALEGTNVADDVRKRHEQLANSRRERHQGVIDRLQQNMMEAASRKAAAEGVKQAVANLKAWSQKTSEKTKRPVELPLTEIALHEARRDEQVLHGEIENRLALAEELEKKAEDVGDSESLGELHEVKRQLKRSNSDLKGHRDNIFDAINGLQTVNSEAEKLARCVDAAGAKIRNSRLPEAETEVGQLQNQAENLERITENLCDIPNVTQTEPVIQKTKDLRRRVDSCAQELEAKKGKAAELESLDADFEGAKNQLTSWIGALDEEMKALEKVSINREKLAEQRKEIQELADRQQEGHSKLDDLEAIAMKIGGASDENKAGNSQRQVSELSGRLQRQASELKARGDKINKLDGKATAFVDSERAVLEYMEKRKEQLEGLPVPVTKEGVKSQLMDLERMDKTGRGEQRRVEETRLSARELGREASIDTEAMEMATKEKNLTDRWDELANAFDEARERTRNAEKVLDECAQIEKWIGAKKKMVEAIGAPSTDQAVAKSQNGQIQLMKAETDGEKTTLEAVNTLANELMSRAADKQSVEELMKKMDVLNRRWHSLESGLDEKAERVEEAAKLGRELREIQKELRKELNELESNVEKASRMSPNDIGDQLATLDSLKSRFGGVDKALGKLKTILEATEDLEVDATNRAEIQEQLESTQKKADELERKIENVKKAALNAQNEGMELEKRLDELIGVVSSAENELEQAAPIAADSQKLLEDSKRAETLFQQLIDHEGDVSLLRAKVAEEIKKKPDAELKKKLELLNSKWPKALGAARDRKDLLTKAGELVKQFGESEHALEQRLQGDQHELDGLLNSEDPEACDALKLVEMTMARRLADVDALNAIMNRIEAAAPGPDANRLRRRAEKLADDVKSMAKKARTAAAAAQRKHDFSAKFERLVEEIRQFLENQKAKIEEAVEKDQMNGERVQSKLNEIEDFWSLKSRELKAVGDEIKKDGCSPDDAQNVDQKIGDLQSGIDELLAILHSQSDRLAEKKEAADQIQAESQKASAKINSLVAEIADLDPIGRSREELRKQKEEILNLNGDLDSAQTKVMELGAEWEAALGAGIVTQPAFETNRANADELNKLAARAGKRLAQREKKLVETESEIDKLHGDADEIVTALVAISSDESIQNTSSQQLQDPKQVAEKVRKLKESLKPVGEKMDSFNSDCKLMIKTAGPEADTKELDSLLKRVGDAYSDVVGKVSDKEMTVDAAVQQQGKVEDAYRALLNWLEETEEMMENQKKPSADAKVAKAQLHAYEVLMKHVEDKKPSVDGFKTMIEKMVEGGGADGSDRKALLNKNQEIDDRYKELLNSAVDRQRKLLDAVDLAERLQEFTIPLDQWLISAEKRLQGLAKVPITVEKAQEMLGEQEALQEELALKSDDLSSILELAPMLASLVSVEDANVISGQVAQLESRARALDAGITNMRPLLESFLQQIQDFTLDEEDMTRFVGETEVKLSDLDELPIEPDDLVEQTNILAEIAVSIADRDEMMANIFEVGKQLAIQGEPEEALIAQKRLDDLKFRYADLMTSADEKIALLAKAIPLSEGFHDGFDNVMQVLEDMDRDLQTIDEEDPDTQAELIFLLEEDISQKIRPGVDDLTVLSTQLQALCSADKADELFANTVAMNKLVNSVADRVARRAERIEMASKQSRAVLDDLQYLIEWFSAARERILEGALPSLDLECLKSQLKHQRIINEEAGANKVQFRNVAGEAKKVARQLGMEGNEANDKISDTVDEGKELVEEVMSLCADRTETLERALALMEQLTAQFDELNKWLDQMDGELQGAASVTTATPAAELREMHDHNEELARSVAAYRPIIEGFKSDVGALEEILAEDQSPLLESVAGELVQGYEDVREAVRARGHAIDNMMGATIGFGERLETLVANLQGAADRLKENEGISADPSVLESRLAENRSIVESLRDKQNAYDALKQTANELLATAPEGTGGDVENKLNRLDKLWKEIEREAQDRGVVLEDVLEKAKHFWSELDSCQKAVDDLRNRLELVEPATGHPEQLEEQQQIMAQVANEMERTRPRIEALSIAGQQLAGYVPDDEKAVIESQVANVRGGFSTITGLFAEKKRDLIAAMEEAMAFHGDLQSLMKWLDTAEGRLLKMAPVEHAKQMTEIGHMLDELHRFKDEVDERGVAKEQVVATALQLAADAPPHLAATVRQPVAELNGRWTRLNAALAEREHKLENSMLQMGKLADAIAQLTAWMDKTKTTLREIAPPKTAMNLRDIEIAQCKLVVLSNDVHAHQHSVDTVNNAAQQYIRTSGALDAETSEKLGEMNVKWEEIQKLLKSLASEIEMSKKEAENVGGEVERWQRWLEETEAALQSTKPTGGLPETAEFQLDEFNALKQDVETNSQPLETHLTATERYLREEETQGEDTWLAKTHATMKTKWSKVKELLVDREKKLQLAYEQAVALENALNDMEGWIVDAERKLTDLPPISRLPELIEKQLSEHESWMDEVAGRKTSMTQHQASGVRMQYYCEKKDAIPIKNRLVSLKHRVEKIAGRSAERAKQLATTRDEVATWQDGLHELEHFVADVLERIAAEPGTTSSLDKLKAKLEEVKEAQRDVTGKQTLFDVTRKRGIGLAERATRSEYKQIAMSNEKMSKRWNEMIKKLRDRLREAEQAVLEGGVFEESMNDLETWVDEELQRYQEAEHQPVFGDIDVVRQLVDEETRRAAERKTKENGVKTVVKKADALLASGVDEKDSIAQAKERLVEKWQKVEEAARQRGDSIKEAEQAAEEFDAKTHALLDWLAVEEQKLKSAGLADVETVKAEMDEAKERYDGCLEKGDEILTKCQPSAEPILRNWMRVVEARWKEVKEKVDEREFSLLEDEQKAKEHNEQIQKLAKFAAQKREELNKMIEKPPAQDLETMEQNLREFGELDFELREQQPEVDAACKASKKGGVRNAAAEMLSTEWKKLWLDAMGLQSSLDNQKALLEEMKRLEGWKWEDWKERYVEWNDHAKARVSDLFRRIDRLHTGNVPRQVFIDGIIGSKFPTSRLEMEKVADLFDKGDGMINAKEFINALRFDSANRNAKPQTDTEKITHEIERQKKTCSCCTPYQIEKISENHYRFGDTHIKRMVRILRSTVMVRVGGGWESLDEFLHKHDPCRAKGRLNINMFPESRPTHALDSMRAFTKNRHAKEAGLPTSGTPGPIMKIREKTDRSVPMSGGLGGTAGYTVTTTPDHRPSRIPRAPSDMSAGKLSRVGSTSNSKGSLFDSPSRPDSRASSEAGDKQLQTQQTRIPSLRGRKGQRYTPQQHAPGCSSQSKNN